MMGDGGGWWVDPGEYPAEDEALPTSAIPECLM